MGTDSAHFLTASPGETRELGRALGELLGQGSFVGFTGDLGSGKTVIIQGVAAGLGYDGYVVSPSFVIVNEYACDPRICHVDLYRIGDPAELDAIGYREIFYPEGVALVEWADRAEELLPPDRLDVRIAVAGRTAREFVFTARGDRAALVLKALRASWGKRGDRADTHD
jgi:tRNA threonylcarbamoyladenosine biosynthesis protein TsaE